MTPGGAATGTTAAGGLHGTDGILARLWEQRDYYERVAAVAASDVLPVTSFQLDSMMFGLDASHFAVHRAYRVRGPLDLARLDRAIRAVCDRHPALACQLVPSDLPIQRIRSPRELAAQPVVSEVATVCSGDAPLVERLMAEVQQPATSESSKLRAAVARLDGTESIVHLGCHHLFIDGATAPLVFADVWRSYAADKGPMGAVDEAYGDYLRAESRYLARVDDDDVHMRHWYRKLDRLIDARQLPATIVERRANAGPSARTVTARRFPSDIGLTAGARALEVTPTALALATGGRALRESTSGDYFAPITLVAGATRSRSLRTVVGATVMCCPVPFLSDTRSSLSEVARAAMGAFVGTIRHSAVPPLFAVRRRILEFAASHIPSGDFVLVNHVLETRPDLNAAAALLDAGLSISDWEPDAPMVTGTDRRGFFEIVWKEGQSATEVTIKHEAAAYPESFATDVLDRIEGDVRAAARA